VASILRPGLSVITVDLNAMSSIEATLRSDLA
jgi:hypothetical protein